MPSNEYQFVTVWRLRGTVQEVADIIGDGPSLARWWPSVYLGVKELAPGDAQGVGKVIELYTKGWLPYTLRWSFCVTAVRSDGFTLEASGDFVGRGIWTFAQDGPCAVITYDWRIRADKPLLRYLSFVMKPIFSANHHWAMAQGERSLQLELERRRATNQEELRRIPPPPPATTALPLMVGAGVLTAVALAVYLGRRRRYFAP